MYRLYILIIFSLLVNVLIPSILAEKNEENSESISTTKLNWESDASNFKNQLDWEKVDEVEIFHELIKTKNINKSDTYCFI